MWRTLVSCSRALMRLQNSFHVAVSETLEREGDAERGEGKDQRARWGDGTSRGDRWASGGDNLERGVETRGRTLTRVCAACAVCRHLVPRGRRRRRAWRAPCPPSGRASTLGLAAVRCVPGRVGVSRENVPRTSACSARQSPRRFQKTRLSLALRPLRQAP